MPSASTKTANTAPPINMPDLLHEPIKNVVCVLDKKLRNLEKRKIKLVETKRKAEEGSELNEDQKKALENLILVDNSLATVKEVHKNLTSLEQEYLKLLKRDQKRVKQEQKELFETKSQESVCRTIQIQAILGELTEEVRPDFLNAANGACQLTEDELSHLDSFYELINVSSENKKTNFSSRVKEVGLHLFNLIEAKEKPALENVTYKQLNEILTRIHDCGYFDKDEEVVEEEPELIEEEPEEEEDEEFASVDGDEHIPVVEPEPMNTFPSEDTTEEFVATDIEPISEPFLEEPVVEEVPAEMEQSVVPMEAINGVDLPPEVQQMQQSPDNEKIDFMGESEISPAMLESQQQSLNPVSPEFIPRNMQPLMDEGNGWCEPPSAPQAASSEWNESPATTDSDWQAVPDFNQGNQGGGGFRGRGGRGGGRGFGGRGRGRGGGGGGGFRGGRQDGYNNRDGGNYRGNRGGRGNRGDGNRGPRGGSRGGSGGRGGRGGGGGGFGGGFNNRSSAPQ